MKKIYIFLLAVAVYCPLSTAQDSEVPLLFDGTELFLRSTGVFEDLGQDIFAAAVYLPPLVFDLNEDASKRMEMRIVAEQLSARRFTRLWLDSITLNSSRDERNTYADQILQFSELLQENLLHGDHISFDFIKDQNITVLLLNSFKVGEIVDDGFYQLLMNGWIGDTPSSSHLKAGILKELDEAELAESNELYSSLHYSEERSKELDHIFNFELEQERLEQERLAEIARQEEEQRRLEEEALLAAQILEAERLEFEKQEQVRLAELAEQQRIEEENARIAFEAEQKVLREQYTSELKSWILSKVSYPDRALRRNLEGKLRIRIKVDREGGIVSRDIVESSDAVALDEESLKMVEKSEPLPKMPVELVGETFSFVMPLTFELEN